jgi:hypothetical protein
MGAKKLKVLDARTMEFQNGTNEYKVHILRSAARGYDKSCKDYINILKQIEEIEKR